MICLHGRASLKRINYAEARKKKNLNHNNDFITLTEVVTRPLKKVTYREIKLVILQCNTC